uniref:Uncharacterized protein n=1 Tax=Glossina brevipalpis TaxID=37001 RepID=A0A1A9WHP2_9MUSC
MNRHCRRRCRSRVRSHCSRRRRSRSHSHLILPSSLYSLSFHSMAGWLVACVFSSCCCCCAAGANVVFRFNTLGTTKIRKNTKTYLHGNANKARRKANGSIKKTTNKTVQQQTRNKFMVERMSSSSSSSSSFNILVYNFALMMRFFFLYSSRSSSSLIGTNSKVIFKLTNSH